MRFYPQLSSFKRARADFNVLIIDAGRRKRGRSVTFYRCREARTRENRQRKALISFNPAREQDESVREGGKGREREKKVRVLEC